MPTIVIRHPDGSTEEREVTGRLTVGCDEENDLVLRAGGVSQRHAQFFADGGELVLENVGAAAATIVDGETIAAPRRLKHGVRVLIGEYELWLKPDQVSLRKLAPVAIPEATLKDEEPHRGPAAPSARSGWRLLLGLAAALVAALAIAAGLLIPGGPGAAGPTPPAALVGDPCAELEPQLKLARGEPSEAALAAANTVLECDPLGPEILALKRSLEKELKGAAAAERATRLIELDRDEQALEALKEIPEGTRAFHSARPQAVDAAARINKRASKACLAYAKEGKWLQAQPACESAMEIACQGMPADELFKPRHPVLINLLKARQTNDPSGPRWGCIALPLIAPALAPADPARALRTAIAGRIADPQLAGVVGLYAEGKLAEAIVQLQVVSEKSSKAALHAQAEALRKNISNVDSLKKIGDGMLDKGELDKAARIYREALELDGRLLPEHERFPSATRRSIQDQMAQAALRIGLPLARRPDLPRACAAFRLGFSFFRGNAQLNQALAEECSTHAKALLDSATSCPELDRALELAVPGDLIAEAIASRKPQLGCR